MLLALALPCLAVADAHAASLRGALATAYDRNPTLNAQRAATRAADEAIAQAKAGYRPQVFSDVNFGFQRTVSRSRAVNPITGATFRAKQGTSSVPFSYGVTVSQALFSGFQVVNNVNQAEARVRASRSELTRTEQDVFFAVAAAYADIVLARRLVSIRQRNRAFLREQVRSAQARLEVGEGTRTDVAQSRARLSLGDSQITLARADLESARAQYRQVVGAQDSGTSEPTVPERLICGSLASCTSLGLSAHPAIRASEHLVDAQAFAVKVAEGTLLPSLSANISATESYDLGASDGRTTNVQGLLQLSIPIYQGGQATAQVRQSKEVLGQQRVILDQTRDQVRAAVATAYAVYSSAGSVLASSRSQIAAARLALDGVVEERNVGQRTQLDVLEAQSTLLDAQEQVANARRNRVVAAYDLLRSTGRLTARRLGLHVDVYSPKAHYVETVDRWYGLRTPDKR